MIMNTAIDERQNQRIAAVSSTGIIGAIILILWTITLFRPDPLPSEKIIEFDLGVPNAGGGGGGGSDKSIVKDAGATNPPASEITSKSEDASSTTQPVTTNTKPSNTTNNNSKPNNKPINSNALFENSSDNGTGNGTGTGNGNGNGSGNGNGNGSGNGNGNGSGFGNGNGPGTEPGTSGDYILEGRKFVSKPAIKESFEDEGKVVVNVWVDQNGNVTRASINESQTNTSSKQLRDIALRAAKKWKYDSNTNAAVEQKGVVIYKFTLN